MEILLLLFLILMLIIFFVFQIKRLAKPKSKSNITVTTNVANRNYNTEQSLMNFKINSGEKIQFLESVDIINNTASLDTLEGRYNFLLKLLPTMLMASKQVRYFNDCQIAIDSFKTSYYDKTLWNYEIELLIKPSEESLKEFLSISIFKCFATYEAKQENEIINLKSNAAIEKRRDNIIKIGYNAKYLFKTYDLPDNGNLEAIEIIRQKYYFKKN